jgi:hypothetical protein
MLVGGAVYMSLEYWLGKTDKVKAGSTLELVLSGLKAGLAVVLGRK